MENWQSQWQQWMQGYLQAVTPAAPGSVSDEITRGYQQFVEQLAGVMQGQGNGADAAPFSAWLNSLREALQTAGDAPLDSAWVMSGAKACSQFNQTMSFAPGAALLAQASSWSREWLSLPNLGPETNLMRAQKAWARAAFECFDAHAALLKLNRDTAGIALARFEKFLREDNKVVIDSPRALYDHWVDIAEQAHHELLLNETYSEAFGNWVNKQTALRRCTARLGRETQYLAGWVSPSEQSDLHNRYRQLEAEVLSLRETLNNNAQAAQSNKQPKATDKTHTTTDKVAGAAPAKSGGSAKRTRKTARNSPGKPIRNKANRKKTASGKTASETGGKLQPEFDIGDILQSPKPH